MANDTKSQTPAAAEGMKPLWLPRLIAITDAQRLGIGATIDAASRLCARALPRSIVIQLRDNELQRDEAWDLGHALLRICQAHEQELCINDRLELGLHLGTPRFHRKPSSPTVAAIRTNLGARVGSSWLTQGWHPVSEPPPIGVDAVLVSPVMAERKGRLALGLTALGLAVTRVQPVPVFALGGISGSNVPGVMETNVAGVAVQAAWYSEPELLLSALGVARAGD